MKKKNKVTPGAVVIAVSALLLLVIPFLTDNKIGRAHV